MGKTRQPELGSSREGALRGSSRKAPLGCTRLHSAALGSCRLGVGVGGAARPWSAPVPSAGPGTEIEVRNRLERPQRRSLREDVRKCADLVLPPVLKQAY